MAFPPFHRAAVVSHKGVPRGPCRSSRAHLSKARWRTATAHGSQRRLHPAPTRTKPSRCVVAQRSQRKRSATRPNNGQGGVAARPLGNQRRRAPSAAATGQSVAVGRRPGPAGTQTIHAPASWILAGAPRGRGKEWRLELWDSHEQE
ncbi:hypothetical protein FH972_024944 [Carpinus fangiana]|uniref:Uncharacterized protein n=1 Tax=Carpinus fangiana TaxID=176857 RepID=A0A5N6L057_9ROSI|nr:hypothetical protein FH972_024944 [Carpinus fangiana]